MYFLVNSSLNIFNRKYIIFDGIDTISEIYINNKLIGTTNNMFVKYTFSIEKYLNVSKSLTFSNIWKVVKKPASPSWEGLAS